MTASIPNVVTLDGALARDLALEVIGNTRDGWTVVADEYVGEHKYGAPHRLVITDGTGWYAATYRETGAGAASWAWEDHVSFDRVVPTEVTVTTYTPWTEVSS